MAKKRAGRKKGGHNRGYFFRKGRGWYATGSGRMVPLRYENGDPIKEPGADERELREALARHLLQKQPLASEPDNVTVLEVCRSYLANAKATGAAKTHQDRADTLFDFCFGVPPAYRHYSKLDAFRTADARKFTKEKQAEAEQKRIHKGYGSMPVGELRPLDVTAWLNAHTTWSQSGRRSRIQAVKRALNFAVEERLIERNPIRGYRTPKSHPRVTHITHSQEELLVRHARPALAAAIKVCIRTGTRFGSEFAVLTRKHVVDHGDRMEWVFQPDEVKNRKKRIIFITDPEVMTMTRARMAEHPEGPIWRNSDGEPWSKKNLSQRFRFLKQRLERQGHEFDEDCCMYSCRHTYAKRMLQGFWSGKSINIETLARLMGNTPQVCREHYLQWSEADNEHLWEVA